jgi:hypothetical protein
VDKLGAEHQLIVELFWRDFYSHIAFFSPHIFRGSFYPKYNALAWDASTQKFDAWRTGRTGFPVVDAGIRELNATGFMHNRVRMIVASFLVKDLTSIGVGESAISRKILSTMTAPLTTVTGSGALRPDAMHNRIFEFSIRGCNSDVMILTVDI